MVQACSSWFRPKGLWICCSKTCIDWHTIRRCASHWVQSSGPLKFSKPCKKGQYLSLMTPRALLWLWPIRTYHPSWFLSLWLAASQSIQLCGCFSSGPMLVPSLPFPIDLIHWHKPIKGNFPCEPTKSTKCNLILVYFNMHASTRNPDDPGCTAHLDMDSPFLGSRWNSSTSLAEIHYKVYSEYCR